MADCQCTGGRPCYRCSTAQPSDLPPVDSVFDPLVLTETNRARGWLFLPWRRKALVFDHRPRR